MKRILYIVMLLLPVISSQAADDKSGIYLADYVLRDEFLILDGRIVPLDSLFMLDQSDIERFEVHGRARHPYPELKYLLNGEPISQGAAGNIKVADILWMKFVDDLTLSIITDPEKVMYVVDGRVADPDSLPKSEDVVRKDYEVLPDWWSIDRKK